MSNIGHLVVCDEVFNTDGQLIIKQPLGMIFPISLPTNYTFEISVGLINLKQGNEYAVKVEFVTPSGGRLLDQTLEFVLDESSQPEEAIAMGGFNINCRNMELIDEGNYVVRVTLDEEIKELVLPVRKRIEHSDSR